MVPGYLSLDDPGEQVGAALRQAAARGARVVSVCTGAFALAAAGLLDNRRAATQHPAKLIEPPPRSTEWLACCWDCKTPDAGNRASTVNYAPSTAPLPTPDGGEVIGQFTTPAVGLADFQVFTADYVEAQVRKAVVWNPDPPDSIATRSRLIWPHRLRAAGVAWSPPAFPNDNFDRLVNRDMAPRRGTG